MLDNLPQSPIWNDEDPDAVLAEGLRIYYADLAILQDRWAATFERFLGDTNSIRAKEAERIANFLRHEAAKSRLISKP